MRILCIALALLALTSPLQSQTPQSVPAPSDLPPPFDLDGYLESLNPPSHEQLLDMIGPIPSTEDILSELSADQRAQPLDEAARTQLEQIQKEHEHAGYNGNLQALRDTAVRALTLCEASLPAGHWQIKQWSIELDTAEHWLDLTQAGQVQIKWALSEQKTMRELLDSAGSVSRAMTLAKKRLAVFEKWSGRDSLAFLIAFAESHQAMSRHDSAKTV